MIINSIDLGGASNPFLKPVVGQVRGDAMVEGLGHLAFPRGAAFQEIPVEFWVRAWQGIGGSAAGGMAAAQLLVKQLEELTNNPRMNPAYIRWNATADPTGYNAPDPHDGWWLIENFQPDYSTFVPSGWVKCSMKVTFIGGGLAAPVNLWHAGGALASNFSQIGTAKNILGAPLNSGFLQGTATRISGEGGVNYTGNPVSPTPITLSSKVSDWFKGGVRIFDTLNTPVNAVPVAATATLWRSLGTEAGTDNSIAYWTQTAGVWTYAAHLATSPSIANSATAALTGGHPDWPDGVALVRVKCPTNATAYLAIHATGGFANCIDLSLSAGASPGMEKRPSGGYASLGAIGGANAVAGTVYWLQISGIGTLYTFSWYDDSAGAPGSLRGTQTISITDGSLQAGAMCLMAYNSTATPETVSFGGAFANVCTFRGPVPTNAGSPLLVQPNAGEPAFCWSQNNPDTGSYSMSTYVASASGYGRIDFPVPPVANGTVLTVSMRYRGPSTTGPMFFTNFGSADVVPPSVAIGPGWATDTQTIVANGSGGLHLYLTPGYGTAPLAGTYYWDVVSVYAGSTPVLLEAFERPYNGNWVEVFDAAHNFAGDCVLVNGLTLLFFAVGRADLGVHFLWNPALESAGWQLVGTYLYYDNANAIGTTSAIAVKRVGPSESSVIITAGTANGHVADIRFRLKRGHWTAGLTLKPRTQAATSPRSLSFSVVPGNPRILYNAGSAADPTRSEGLGVPTDYGFMAAFNLVAGAPFICGWLLPNQPVGNLGWSDGFAQIAPGDTTSLAINAEREVGFFAVHYGAFGLFTPINLQIEGEAGILGTGWSSVNDGGVQSAKCVSGTGIGNALDQVPGDNRRTAGLYRAYFRVRVASAASGTIQMSLNVYDTTTSTVLVTTGALAPSAFLTTYAWYSPGTFTIVEGHLIHGYVQVVNNPTNTDWFVEEVILVPLELFSAGRDSESGPRDLWKSFAYDADVEMIVA